jgi:hypothetical protein
MLIVMNFALGMEMMLLNRSLPVSMSAVGVLQPSG